MDISYIVKSPIARFILRSRKVSKAWDRVLKCSYRFEIWQTRRQKRCRGACHISEQSDNSKYKSRGFETLRDLIISLIGYRYRALISVWSQTHYYFANIGYRLSVYPEWFCVAHRWPVIFFIVVILDIKNKVSRKQLRCSLISLSSGSRVANESIIQTMWQLNLLSLADWMRIFRCIK